MHWTHTIAANLKLELSMQHKCSSFFTLASSFILTLHQNPLLLDYKGTSFRLFFFKLLSYRMIVSHYSDTANILSNNYLLFMDYRITNIQ